MDQKLCQDTNARGEYKRVFWTLVRIRDDCRTVCPFPQVALPSSFNCDTEFLKRKKKIDNFVTNIVNNTAFHSHIINNPVRFLNKKQNKIISDRSVLFL